MPATLCRASIVAWIGCLLSVSSASPLQDDRATGSSNQQNQDNIFQTGAALEDPDVRISKSVLYKTSTTSCDRLLETHSFVGSCCSLTPLAGGGCHLYVVWGTCYVTGPEWYLDYASTSYGTLPDGQKGCPLGYNDIIGLDKFGFTMFEDPSDERSQACYDVSSFVYKNGRRPKNPETVRNCDWVARQKPSRRRRICRNRNGKNNNNQRLPRVREYCPVACGFCDRRTVRLDPPLEVYQYTKRDCRGLFDPLFYEIRSVKTLGKDSYCLGIHANPWSPDWDPKLTSVRVDRRGCNDHWSDCQDPDCTKCYDKVTRSKIRDTFWVQQFCYDNLETETSVSVSGPVESLALFESRIDDGRCDDDVPRKTSAPMIFDPPLELVSYDRGESCDGSSSSMGTIKSLEVIGEGSYCLTREIPETTDIGDGTTTAYLRIDADKYQGENKWEQWADCTDSQCVACDSLSDDMLLTQWSWTSEEGNHMCYSGYYNQRQLNFFGVKADSYETIDSLITLIYGDSWIAPQQGIVPQQQQSLTEESFWEASCNGVVGGCALRVNEVLYPTLHNGMASFADGFAFWPNHKFQLEDALAAGYRGLNLDICSCGGQLVFCHGVCFLAPREIQEVFIAVNQFLDDNPNEVIVFLYQINNDVFFNDDEPDVDLNNFYSQMMLVDGMVDKLYVHDDSESGGNWPTLGELVNPEVNKRIIMFHYNGPDCSKDPMACPAGLHDYKDYIATNDWEYSSVREVQNRETSCLLTTKDSKDFIGINNFVSPPSWLSARRINSYKSSNNYITSCENQLGKPVNFLLVDYWSEGNVVRVAQDTNLDRVAKKQLAGGDADWFY